MLGELLNEFIKNCWKYEIHVEKYYWTNDQRPFEQSGTPGIHILVKINDEYMVSIIQAFDEANGGFYGEDIWEMALKNNSGYLVHVNHPQWRGDTVCLCTHDEIVKFIEMFIKKYNGG